LRAAVRTLLVIALAVALLAVFLRNADLTRVWTEMKGARADLLFLAFTLTIAMYVVRAERWQYLLAPLGKTGFRAAFRTTVIGFAASFVLPARAGEVLRPYLLARQERLPVTATFATIIVERMLDLVAVLLLLAVFLVALESGEAAASPRLYQTVWYGGALAAPIGLGMLAAMFMMAGHPERLHAVVLRVERVLPARVARKVAVLAKTFAEGLAVVRHPSRLVWAMAWSLVLWLAIAAQTWLVVRAFGIMVPFAGSFLIAAMLVVGVSVPTPGGVGGTHEVLRLALTSFYAADNNAAVGTAILQHAVNFVPVLVLGLVFIAQDGLNFSRLRAITAEAKPQGVTP
jgi:glycosyltransferase 2 family protein